MDKIDKSMVFSKDECWILLQLATEAVQNDPNDFKAASIARKIRVHLGIESKGV